ncbi:hypothetical protein C3941_19435 [Kaistia algarum]|nr:hypothetical protein C3941_19435 [Kaistia algarum]
MRRHRGTYWVALVAAYVLLAQALFGALATGASAAPVQFDLAGHIICASQGAERLPGDSAPIGQHHLPDCCLVGCSMFMSAALPAQGAAGVLRLPARPATIAFAVRESTHRVADRGGSPSKPRAPPIPV